MVGVAEKAVLRVVDLLDWLAPIDSVNWDRGAKGIAQKVVLSIFISIHLSIYLFISISIYVQLFLLRIYLDSILLTPALFVSP